MKITVFFLCLTLITCNRSSRKVKSDYLEFRNGFDSILVSHFPSQLESEIYSVNSYTNEERNNISFFLYCYDQNSGKINKLLTFINKLNILGKYISSDSCLLIINRFETLATLDYGDIPIITDSSKIDKPCYRQMYPVPSFVDYKNPGLNLDIKLDNSFIIYVLEAKPGLYKNYDLVPDPQMPTLWKNGFSRGFAISKQKKIVVYWMSIW